MLTAGTVAVSALLLTVASALAAPSSPPDSLGAVYARELAPHRLPALGPPALRLARAAGPRQDCVAAALCLRGGSGSGHSSVQLTTVPFEVRPTQARMLVRCEQPAAAERGLCCGGERGPCAQTLTSARPVRSSGPGTRADGVSRSLARGTNGKPASRSPSRTSVL